MSTIFKNRRAEQTARELSEELRGISAQIETAERNFNEIEDSDLIEAAIFERSALLKRYAYLLREFRKLGVPAQKSVPGT